MSTEAEAPNGPVSGTATATVASQVSAGSGPVALLDGPCITKTIKRIRNMPAESLARVRAQSEELVGKILDVYAEDIAQGEVGHGGSATASATIIDGLGPTGLLYGRIQSGKTVAMITSTALAVDNGFRVIIVLTTNFLELVRQTTDRFNDLGRVLVRASTEPEEWSKESEIQHLSKTVPQRGLVLICAKHAGHLEKVLDLLEKIGGANYPALILDDEADQASLDNNERRRGRSKKPDEVAATAVHQAILDIRKYLRHHIFLQVTATPYALLLQRVTSPLRPKFTYLLDPGDGYTGGEAFFSRDHLTNGSDEGEPPLVFISEAESREIEGGLERSPRGLENAITYFLVAAAAQAIEDPDVLSRSQNFLCHTSHKRSEHDRLYELIVGFTFELAENLEPLQGRAETLVRWAYAELSKTTTHELPPLEEIVEDIVERLPRRKIRVVNSEGKSGEEVRGAPNFIIGGNIVGRGLTIPNLLVTYYVRKPKISQMDTMLQHARMFGYRIDLMPFTRVFLPRSLALRFWAIHEAEKELRDLLPNIDALAKVPVQVIGELRATRYGVLDTGSVVTIRSGKHLYPTFPDVRLPKARVKRIEGLAREVWPDWSDTGEFGPEMVPVATIESFLEALDCSEWDERALVAILKSVAGEDGVVRVAYRSMNRGKGRMPERTDLATGALSGEALRNARGMNLPTFFLFRQTEGRPCWDNDRFFYPTIVFPKSMPNHVYNDTEIE